jgi:Zn-dependent protease with chaperone function
MGLMIAAALVVVVDAGAAAEGAVVLPRPTEEALRYHWTGNAIWIASQAIGIGLPLLLLATGVVGWLGAWARRIGGRRLGWWPSAVVFAAGFLMLIRLIELPYDYVLGYRRGHAYGLSNQTLGRWASHWAIGAGVEAAMAAAVVPGIYGLIRLSPRRWWLWTGLIALPFTLGMAVLQPVVLDPLFNTQKPLGDHTLEAQIRGLAERCGIGDATILEVDKSRDTKAVNAYVNGWLGTRRIVLWDTLLDRLDRDEVLSVVGHEMGHYVLGHVAQGIAVSSVLVLGGLWLANRLTRWAIARFGARLGVRDLRELEALPLLMSVATSLSLVLTPIGFAFSRHMEHEADRFGLELTRLNGPAASAFVKLYETNKGVPQPAPLYRIFRATHPSMADRVAFLNSYRPWASGQPLAYSHLLGEAPGAAAARTHPGSPRLDGSSDNQ